MIAHDIRSAHNVGSLLRTAEGLGVAKVFLTGITPYPKLPDDSRLPHISEKLDKQIDKTALGAAKTLQWDYRADVFDVIKELRAAGYTVAALEQAEDAVQLPEYNPPDKIALVLGTEVTGLPAEISRLAAVICEIPMFGKKESYNVVQAAAMAIYHFRFR